ncbi:bile acid:sodium symporter family protein [Campylobacter sp. 2018MI13]|uniref:bile acid:sodium symporter family protein n=1 Tax=Campylobacter sp. 2018MI13 TaxID=2836737 RepID=UPI001BDA92BF|nr:bile acid:sodium symporter family protein [Campylobacter sp. 2018MI13]MBT0883312.1 bile acid:sodium symporter family protein [Campylobacter sp. 2018MI13]
MKKISDFISKNLAILVLVCTTFALFYPSISNIIKTSYVNYLLGIIMFGMGLSVRASDFKELFLRPKDVIIGIFAQFIIMPFIAFVLIFVFKLDTALAIGVALVGACPGGTSSNVISYLAKADVALSVSITSCTTILAPIITPFITYLLVGKSIDINAISMFVSIIQVIIIPILLGVLAHKFLPKITEKLQDTLPLISTFGIVAIVMSVVGANATKILDNLGIILVVVMLHNVLGYLLGFFAGKIFKLELAKQKTLAIEVGMQNSGLAASLATTHFAAYPLAAVVAALFSVWHNISGGILATIFRRF